MDDRQRKRQLEAEYGEAMITLLPRMASQHGGLSAVARLWDLSNTSIYKWAREIGLKRTLCYTTDAEDRAAVLTER